MAFATVLSGTTQVLFALAETGGVAIGSRSGQVAQTYTDVYTTGTGVSQLQQLFSDQRTLAGNANEDLNFQSAALKDQVNKFLTLASVRGVAIYAAIANAAAVRYKPSVSIGFNGGLGGTGPFVDIPPGGMMFVSNPITGWTTAGGANSSVNVANLHATLSAIYDIIVWGA